MDIESESENQLYVNRYTPLSISGNNNQIIISDSITTISIFGSQNKMRVDASHIQLQLLGNGNYVHVENSQLDLILKGNSNQVRGFGNHLIKGFENSGYGNIIQGNIQSIVPIHSISNQFHSSFVENNYQPTNQNPLNSANLYSQADPNANQFLWQINQQQQKQIASENINSSLGQSASQNITNKGLGDQWTRMLPISKHQGNQFDCPICLQQVKSGSEVIQLFCADSFHPDCCRNWLIKSTKCPVCQKDIKPY